MKKWMIFLYRTEKQRIVEIKYLMAEANLNYQTIRTTHAAREAVSEKRHTKKNKSITLCHVVQDDQRTENRKKNLIILVLHWLAEEG